MAEAAKKVANNAGGGNGLMVVVIVLLMLLLAGVGGLGYYLFTKTNKLSDKSSSEVEKLHNSVVIFQKLDTFVVNLSGGDGTSMLQVDMQVQLSDDNAKQLLTNLMPKVRSAIILLLSSKTADELSTTEGKMKLKDQVQRVINDSLGFSASPLVQNVLFTSFIIQRQ